MEPAGPSAWPAPHEAVPAEDKTRSKKRTGTSKYDFVKVRVWLGDNMDHYYVLSRFLISRMLTVTKIPAIKATKIALDVKKYLVDNDMLDITQKDFETVLFNILCSRGFNQEYIDCYRMVTEFYQQRQPLVILVCGTAWTGKSTIAQQLANRINIPNVMQTDVMYELLRGLEDTPLHGTPLWARGDLAGEALVGEFRRECRVVRKGMDGDLIKTLSDGKPIIMEGLHLDPGLYIQEFARMGIIMLPARPRTSSPAIRAGALAAQGSARYRRSSSAGRATANRLPPTAQDARPGRQHVRRTVSAHAKLSTRGAPDSHASSPVSSHHGAWQQHSNAGGGVHSLAQAGMALSEPDAAGGSSNLEKLLGRVARATASGRHAQAAGASNYSPFAHHGSELHAWPPALQPIPEDSSSGNLLQETPEPSPQGSGSVSRASLHSTPGLQQQEQQQLEHQQQEQQAQHCPQQQPPQHEQQQLHSVARATSSSSSNSQAAHWQSQSWRSASASSHLRRSSSDGSGATGDALSPPGISREHSTTEQVSREPSYGSLPSQEHSAAHSEGTGSPGEAPASTAVSPGMLAPAGDSGVSASGSAAAGAGASSTGAASPISQQLQQLQPDGQRAAASQQPAKATAVQHPSSSKAARRSNSGSSSSEKEGSMRLRGSVWLNKEQGAMQLPAAGLKKADAEQHRASALPPSPAAAPAQAAEAAAAQAPAAAATAAAGAVLQPLPAQQPEIMHKLPAGPDAARGKTDPGIVPIACQHSSGSQRASATKPLFVPVLVYMDEADHNLLADDAVGGLHGASSEEARRGAVQRMRQLQEYLCAYESQGLPVVRVQYGNFNEALDKLHEYILQCFRKIMGV